MTITGFDVPINAVVGNIGFTIGEPPVHLRMRVVKYLGVRLEPMYLFGFFVEEGSRVAD